MLLAWQTTTYLNVSCTPILRSPLYVDEMMEVSLSDLVDLRSHDRWLPWHNRVVDAPSSSTDNGTEVL